MLIDTHCHFNHERLVEDFEDSLERAELAEVRQMIVVGFDLESSRWAIRLAEAYPHRLFAVVGVHPHGAKDWNAETAHALREMLSHPSVVALGEIGLDFHYDFSPRPAQYLAFEEQLELAAEAALPIVIHCREAYPEVLEILEAQDKKTLHGVMHCWAGNVAEAERTAALGLHLGFGGTLTFKNAEEVRAGAQAVPAERLLVETDAPYLAPVPHRGKRNEPAFTRLVAERLAELREVSFAEISHQTTANAYRLFSRMTRRK